MYNLIVAVDNDFLIGQNNDLAYKLEKDMKYFKSTTTYTEDINKKNAIIMGRKTWESIHCKCLPNRINCVISHNHVDSCLHFYNFEDCIKHLHNLDECEQIFVIGGREIFECAYKYGKIDNIFITRINKSLSNPIDPVYFPKYILHNMGLVWSQKEDDDITFEIYYEPIKSF